MNIKNILCLIAIVTSSIACQPPDRDYGAAAPALGHSERGFQAPESPPVVVTSFPVEESPPCTCIDQDVPLLPAKDVDGDFAVEDCGDMCVAFPKGGAMVGTLPPASKYVGVVFTIKIADPEHGLVDLFPSADPLTGTLDMIDDMEHATIVGNGAAVQVRAAYEGRWSVISQYQP